MGFSSRLLTKVVGDPTTRELRRHRDAVAEINELEASFETLSDEELLAKTAEFRERLGVEGIDDSLGQPMGTRAVDTAGEGEDEEDEEEEARQDAAEAREDRRRALDELLPEAFAAVREAARRSLGMRHFDVQLIGGMVLHQGKIAEMKTGEGKTLVATLPLYLRALEGRGAHLVTVNDYLARRDAGWNGPLYRALGMTVGVIAQEMSLVFDPEYTDESHPDPRLQHLRPVTRREAYACDITYATNNELGFDYLRDNIAPTIETCVQRQLNYAIVDEVDSILIDEARTPLIISGAGQEPTEKYYTYARLVPRLVPEEDFTVDEKTKSAALTDEGMAKVEKWTGYRNLYDAEQVAEAHQINQALKAHALYLRDRDYIVRDGEVVIVDEFTGRTMPGRRWSDGLHQAVEAKEGLRVQQENVTVATITFQNLFRVYGALAGMTGTAITEAEEFHKIYKLEVVPIPTNQPMIRRDERDLIYKTEEAKYNAVVEDIVERHATGQPVLVGTTSIEKSERLARLLDKRGVQHDVLNAKLHEREAAVVAGAGQKGAVTIATNMAGRGTDIVLGEGVVDSGGLYIIGTERHESRRIDNQLRGRAGRQGDPGETRFYLSFEDDLMRVFGGERMQGIMNKLGIEDDQPIESGMVTRQIEGAQSRVEGHNFDTRRHLVEYDDVMNKQREIIYAERRKLLEGEDSRGSFLDLLERTVREEVPLFCISRHREGWDLEGLWERMRQLAPLPEASTVNLDSLGDTVDDVTQTLIDEMVTLYEEREKLYGDEMMRYAERVVMLSVVDQRWSAYLTQMTHLREGAHFQAYGQKDPLIEFKNEAFASFQELTTDIRTEIVRQLSHVTIRQDAQAAPDGAAAPERPAEAAGRSAPSPGTPSSARATATTAAAPPSPGGPAVSSGPPTPAPPTAGGGGAAASTGAGLAPSADGKVGRNRPCPCGSGRKYKFCHGRTGGVAA